MRTWLAVVAMGLFTLSCSDSEETEGSGGTSSAGGAGTVGGGGSFVSTTTGMGGAPPPPMCDPLDYTDMSLFQPSAVSFSADVLPIFQNGCTGNGISCHSTADPTPSNGLALAPAPNMTPTQSEIDAAHGRIVGADSGRTTLELVTPGDLEASFLLIKVEYPVPGICLPEGAACTPSCGNDMPAGNGAVPLSDTDKAILRTWIRDGALND